MDLEMMAHGKMDAIAQSRSMTRLLARDGRAGYSAARVPDCRYL
jgi:hypothetical protein